MFRSRLSFLLPVCLMVITACDGCKSGRMEVSDDVTDVEKGQHVSVQGTLSMRGSTPFSILVLETSDGGAIEIDADDEALRTELRGLVGLNCSVDGTVATPTSPGSMRVIATRYELMPLPSGELPIVGVLSTEDGECVLETKDRKRYWIRGDLAAAIRQYDGARIWIVGEKADTDAPNRPRKSTPFTPTGYGVLDEAPAK